jgi:hypothetical protein
MNQLNGINIVISFSIAVSSYSQLLKRKKYERMFLCMDFDIVLFNWMGATIF